MADGFHNEHQEQLAAVEGGGGMKLLADRLGYVQLAEPVPFTAAWERDASLRLRRGDATALDEYDQHGRIRRAPPDQAIHAYVASYLAGQDVLLMADRRSCSRPSRKSRIRQRSSGSSRSATANPRPLSDPSWAMSVRKSTGTGNVFEGLAG